MRKLNNIKRKDKILQLRSEGKTYREISSILGCSKSVISYHCGNGNEKVRLQKLNKTKSNKLSKKVSGFKCRTARKIFRGKVKTFKRRSPKGRSHTKVNNISVNFSTKDVLDKIGKNPICYITGRKINLSKSETYHFDHIIPTSKGGSNDLSNLGVCIVDANYAKGNLSLPKLHDLCEEILSWRDKQKLL